MRQKREGKAEVKWTGIKWAKMKSTEAESCEIGREYKEDTDHSCISNLE